MFICQFYEIIFKILQKNLTDFYQLLPDFRKLVKCDG